MIFTVLYLASTFIFIPVIAPFFGRAALPVFETQNLRPLTIFTCLLNRHYVKNDLKVITFGISEKLHGTYPGSVVNYMDANFPFIDGFPLIPHLTHHDGRKLDLALSYLHNGRMSNQTPSIIGYGASEPVRETEPDMPGLCARSGFWQYSFMSRLISLRNGFNLDEKRTRAAVMAFAGNDRISVIFIEPHLKQRLKLTSPKIRFHGCRAVRHDDHFHVVLN